MPDHLRLYSLTLLAGLTLLAACGKEPSPESDPATLLRRVWMAKRVYEKNGNEIMEVVYFNPGRYGTYTWRVDLYVDRVQDPDRTYEEKGEWEVQDRNTIVLTPDGGEPVVIPFQWQGGDLLFSYRGYAWHLIDRRHFDF